MTGQYSTHTTINNEANQAVDYVASEIVRLFRPRSIFLTGSFGRGEVTAVVVGGKVEFLSDCEVCIISLRCLPRAKVAQLARNVKERFNLELSVYGLKISLYLILPGMSRWIKPTMQNYDLRYGSKKIYGKNYLTKIPNFRPEDIPFWEGLRLMFNRMAEGLKYLSVNDEPDSMSVYWLYKIVLACQDTILLSLNNYAPSYRARNLTFQEIFPKYFPDLNAALPEFLPITQEATSFKLTGTVHNDNPDRHLQSKVIQICDQVFRWAINRKTGIDFYDHIEFQKSYLGELMTKTGNYFVFPTLLQNIGSFIEMLFVKRSYISLKLMSRIYLPWRHTVYSLIPLIYFARTPQGDLNTSYLNQARKVLSLFKDLERQKDDALAEYKYLRQETISLWYALCY